MEKKGWELIEDVGDRPLLPDELELVSPLLKEEEYIGGEELLRRAKEMQAVGQSQAEFLITHEDKIPTAWQGHHLVFAGTIWKDGRKYKRVPYLMGREGCWNLKFDFVEDIFCLGVRLVRPVRPRK